MKKNRLFPLLLVTALLSLSACSLFNDNDIAIHNSYNPPAPTSEDTTGKVYAGGVEGKTVDAVPNALCFKNIGYGKDEKIINTYKTGGENEIEYNINGGEDYFATKTSNNYDLYVPNSTPRNDKHTVILFIHGGAWVSGFKTDVNPYVFDFANRGYVTATIKYTLLKKSMDDPSLSIFRNLDEIDACIDSIKEVLEELGFDTTKSSLVVGGASSGSHLAMLYTYSRGRDSSIPIKFIVNAVGPTDIKPGAWKRFINPTDEVLAAGLDKDAIAAQVSASNIGELQIAGDSNNWNDYQTMRIANGMCGLPYSLEQVEASSDDKVNINHPTAASNSMTKVGGGEDLLSVTSYISTTNNFPIICAYAGKDTIVGINQYANLQTKLEDAGVEYEYIYFQNSGHTEISRDKDVAAYDTFINKIVNWCNTL